MGIWTKVLVVEIKRRQIRGTLQKIKKSEWWLFHEEAELVGSGIISGEIEPLGHKEISVKKENVFSSGIVDFKASRFFQTRICSRQLNIQIWNLKSEFGWRYWYVK